VSVPVSVSVEEKALFAVPLLFIVIVLVLVPSYTLPGSSSVSRPRVHPGGSLAGKDSSPASSTSNSAGSFSTGFPPGSLPSSVIFALIRETWNRETTSQALLQEFRSCRIGSNSIMRKPEG
jgi:hypothetical protein